MRMKSISSYIYNRRSIIGEWLFWLFWYLYGCFYVGSSTNMFTSGAMVWAVGSTFASYSIYRLALVCVHRLFTDSKYIIYLIVLFFAGYVFRALIGELFWQIALRYFDFGTFTKDYNAMINIDGGGMLKRLQFLLFNTDFFLSQPGRWFPVSLKLMIDLVINQRKNNSLEKERMDLEIKLLKSQVNPKFIDESLENIKNVVNTDRKKAEQMTLKLSNMIRYTLYETDVEQVPLQKELDFMINYVDLQETRFADQANINFRLKTRTLDNLMISPLLIFPLLEKAFRCMKSSCEVDIKTQEAVLELKIESDCFPECYHAGVENVQKRLGFLYPNKHRLKVLDNEGSYKVELRLELNQKLLSPN